MSHEHEAKPAKPGNTDFTLEVFWNRAISIVTQQAADLIRTAFAAIVREMGDVATAIFDRDGRMIAHGITGTPGHIVPMSKTIKVFMDHFEVEEMKPGDAFVTNDPWATTGHLLDVVVVSPVFYEERLVAFTANTIHHADMSGLGIGTQAYDVFEEGLLIPPTRLCDGGVENALLLDIVRANVREPDAVLVDLMAQVATNEASGRSLVTLLQECGLTDTAEVADEIFRRSEAACRAAIRSIPNQVCRDHIILDGVGEPIRVECEVTIEDEEVTVDFTGTSPQVRRGINVPLNYTAGYTVFALRCAIGREIPQNHGSMEPFTTIAEEGSIVACRRPAPVSARHLVGQMIPGLILQTISTAVPDTVMADGAGAVWGVNTSGVRQDGRAFAGVLLMSGGVGARPTQDGLSTTQFPTGAKCLPIEISEAEAPILVRKKELAIDSGGAGRTRGGLGQIYSYDFLGDEAPCAANFVCGKLEFPAAGLFGGQSGGKGSIGSATGHDIDPQGRIETEDRVNVTLLTPGGGGYGSPLERDPVAVARDVSLGYVSSAAATSVYGVVLRDGVVDAAATDVERKRATAGRE